MIEIKYDLWVVLILATAPLIYNATEYLTARVFKAIPCALEVEELVCV